ncbi:MAG: urease accessory protein UreH [Nitrospirae bacterium]|nr:MAG: urease accessory protein UreH [Nitrospirota bacterium]
MDSLIPSTLWLGLLLGMTHALDPDHVVAVGTLAAESQSLRRSLWLGVAWGIGHTLMLAIVGSLLLSFKWTIPPILATSFEMLVALMIITLGVMLISRTRQPLVLHAHVHTHETFSHSHVHIHARGESGRHDHHWGTSCRKALAVGMVHGLAGSAALSVAIMATLPSLQAGLLYIFVFGIGTLFGMMVMSLMVTCPFLWVARYTPHWQRHLKVCTGVMAMAFGGTFIWELLS